ncbi:hypothetical protein ZTR_08396 [Talaromyces verruculosus]|nr:hypothetical protein ZTR_08396 [Talaromyces verruculosus]
MVFSSDQPSVPAGQEVEVVDDCDEPPDQNRLHNRPNNDQLYIKSHPAPEKKESLLTRALKSPDLGPVDRVRKASYPTSNASGHSTAELTSDGDLTSPTYSNTSSPPHISTLQLAPALETRIASPPSDPSESKIEADLGRKRCISFACTARQPERPKEIEKKQKTPEDSDATDAPQRKTRLTFVCPSRQTETRPTNRRSPSYISRATRSPPPTSRRTSPASTQANATPARVAEPAPVKKPGSIHMTGLGEFKPSEETRFHEFASSLDEVDEWVAQPTEHQKKITLADCMKKEMAIRKLGEEAEAEAIAEEEEENEMENEDEDDTVDQDDEEDDTSLKHEYSRPPSSMAGSRKTRRPINIPRAQTPDLPDSTDFVCGTLDEDRPLEAAYISCIEERRRKKHIPVPQDIDPSFPTTDPEDNEDDIEEENEDEGEDDDVAVAARIEEDLLRGRSKGTVKKTSRTSPRRVHSPAPRAHGQVSPKRMKSPAPKARHALAPALPTISIPVPRTGVNITGPVQRPHYTRTKSLPRTPNPFFKGLEESRLSGQHISTSGQSVDGTVSRSRELHTRGPIDIIQGLERKRQKRKEKFWRQHCRKAAAKEQSERRATRGKGAERMKELGLEVAERFKAYGVGQDTQLMLSV